eukprot:TRINITY_DN21692_c0_g4_i1.p1 TRINITY_DN21692_c0_g4~~TRINITY_DN21692_c0_g4_i1.p1  ORF type:complete len:1685 (+),score=264.93 TRINITY_DN21692_c0_g4_i1:305-5056(+)
MSASGVAKGVLTGAVVDEFGMPNGFALDGLCTVDSFQQTILILMGRLETKAAIPSRNDGAGDFCGGSSDVAGSTVGNCLSKHDSFDGDESSVCGAPALRLVLRSRVSFGFALRHAALTLDGPNLIYRADGTTQRNLVHTVRSPWTQQIATDCAIAELIIEQLAPGGEGSAYSGLVVGLADPRPGGGAEALGAWPGNDHGGRWLWRSDGAIAHGSVAHQRSDLWRYGAGDVIGFAVGINDVFFLRNGRRVHNVPRHVRGDAEVLGRGGLPVLMVALSCDTVLRLSEGTQCLDLCFDLSCATKADETSESPLAGVTDSSSPALTPPRRRLRRCVSALIWLTRLVEKTFHGSLAWPHHRSPPAPEFWSAPANVSQDEAPEAWFEATLTGTWSSFSKGKTILEELGGESVIQRLLFDAWTTSVKQHGAVVETGLTQDAVKELVINELNIGSTDRGATAIVSAVFRSFEESDSFRQARLAREPEELEWRVVELLEEGSGSVNPCKGAAFVPPGAEVFARKVVDGWLRVERSATFAQTAWLPVVRPDEVTPNFVKKPSLVVAEEPAFARVAMRAFQQSGEPSTLSCLDGVLQDGLPTLGEPYTVEVNIRVLEEQCCQEVCIVAWGSGERCSSLQGLSLCESSVGTPCGGLRSTSRISDGAWHHVACTFDGKERVLWIDHECHAREDLVTQRESRCEPGASESTENKLWVGACPTGVAEDRWTPGLFRGEMKHLYIWKTALGPAFLKARTVVVEEQVREAVADEAATLVFHGLDVRGDGKIGVDDFEPVFGRGREFLFKQFDKDTSGRVGLEQWLQFFTTMKRARSHRHVTQFLRACARNLGQCQRPLHVRADSVHSAVLPSELLLASCAWGWQVEAKPVSLSDDILENVEYEGIKRFRRQVRAAHALLGASTDEVVVELADRVALQQGNHSDCWSKMLSVAEWSQAQPRLLEQAVAHVKLDDMCTVAKLQKILAWTVASGRPVVELLQPPLQDLVSRAATAAKLASAAEAPEGWAQACQEVCHEIAIEILSDTRRDGNDGGASSSACAATTVGADEIAESSKDCKDSENRLTEKPEAASGESDKSLRQASELGVSTAESIPAERADEKKLLTAAVDASFQKMVGSVLFFRFLVLLELNWVVGRDFLPLVDLAAPADSPYGRLLAQVKPRLLGHLKFQQFQKVLQRTEHEGSTPSIILNRKVALTLRERGKVDWEMRRSLIGQLMTEFRRQSGGPKLFRRPWQSRCMKVQFKGEGGEDAGGLYREALDAVAQELHSSALPLLVPCPNAQAEVGDNRDAWVLNPRAATPECARAFEFIGQLLGLALRTGDLLPLALAPFTWKGIVGDERTRDDVRSIDIFAEKHVAILGDAQRPDEEELKAMGGLQFAYPDVTGEEVELIEGGRSLTVTSENASEFARLLLQNRLDFDRVQLQALRRGLAAVVPIQLLRLWSWRDLQERVCGAAEVDTENLKRHTVYKNCSSTTTHVIYMWEAMESFTQKQRRSFLRFVWGRSSLPNVEKWERNFTVQLLPGTDDVRLPCSHTCFFTLDLPTYSSAEVCREKLLYCFTNCMAIDADGAAARSLNWDEDDDV